MLTILTNQICVSPSLSLSLSLSFSLTQKKWFDVARGGNVFHTFNAYNCVETGEVVLHAMRSEPERSGYVFNDYSPSYLHEWRLDPRSGATVGERQLGTVAGEFPCVNPNFVGRKARFGYIARDGLLGTLRQWQYPPIGIVYGSLFLSISLSCTRTHALSL